MDLRIPRSCYIDGLTRRLDQSLIRALSTERHQHNQNYLLFSDCLELITCKPAPAAYQSMSSWVVKWRAKLEEQLDMNNTQSIALAQPPDLVVAWYACVALLGSSFGANGVCGYWDELWLE